MRSMPGRRWSTFAGTDQLQPAYLWFDTSSLPPPPLPDGKRRAPNLRRSTFEPMRPHRFVSKWSLSLSPTHFSWPLTVALVEDTDSDTSGSTQYEAKAAEIATTSQMACGQRLVARGLL